MKEATNPDSKYLGIWEALLPVFILIALLALNVYVFRDDAISGSNQFILLMGGAAAAIVGVRKGIPFESMVDSVARNVQSTTPAILILLMVGALSGTWLISGIIPTLVYYGVQILHPKIFLVACVLICILISLSTGSSWTTSATVGIALIGIAEALGISTGMTAGAILSGAYFGDKMSPLSDTTNLAPAMSGSDLFTHIRYMTITTVPSIVITLVFFLVLGFFGQGTGDAEQIDAIKAAIDSAFWVSPWLFLVPLIVILLIVRKTPPLVALLAGTLLGGLFALIFQPDIVHAVSGIGNTGWRSAYMGIINAITVESSVPTESAMLNELFNAGGMKGMLGTIWLIICAMVFGGVMEGIGALQRITQALLEMATTVFGLFASTVGSCLVLNLTASDQYLALVVPGKMFARAYQDRGLAPENLSRTLEDSGTVTSVLVPWNTCGAYHSSVLQVSLESYVGYAVFNWISPIMTLLVAGLGYRIRLLPSALRGGA